jgi:hypothetical protein
MHSRHRVLVVVRLPPEGPSLHKVGGLVGELSVLYPEHPLVAARAPMVLCMPAVSGGPHLPELQ